MRKDAKCLFGRKVPSLKELKEMTEVALKEGQKPKIYTVDEEVTLTDEEFQRFARDMLADQPWINPIANCMRVINQSTGDKILILPEGYGYGRYTSLEID